MLNSSKSHPEWICTVENPNYHYIKFFYFLTSTNQLVIEIKGILNTETVSLHDFCRLVVKIFQKASYRIHRLAVNLTITEIKNGLKLYGLDQQELLECVDVLQRIHNRSVRRYTLCYLNWKVYSFSLCFIESDFVPENKHVPAGSHYICQRYHHWCHLIPSRKNSVIITRRRRNNYLLDHHNILVTHRNNRFIHHRNQIIICNLAGENVDFFRIQDVKYMKSTK